MPFSRLEFSCAYSPILSSQDVVEKMESQLTERADIEMLSINLDDDIEAAQKHVKDNLMKGLHGFAGDWEHKTVTEFGVRAIPALYLLGNDGNILMTNVEFLQAFGAGKDDLTQIIDDRIAGRDALAAKCRTRRASDQDCVGANV